MLVQKSGLSKRTKILLIIFCALMLPAGYFAYSTYLAPPSTTAPTADTNQSQTEQMVVVTPLNEDLLDDAQVRSFAGRSVTGFVEQQSGIYLDDEVPLPPEKVTVTDPGTGSRLLISWQLPVQKNFNKVRVYRSDSAGTLGEEVYAAKINDSDVLMNYSDHDVINQKTYYYLVVTVNANDRTSKNNGQYPGTPHDTFPPSAPLNVAVKNLSDNQVKISWMAPSDPDFSTVHIYKSAQRGVLGGKINAEIQDEQGNGQYALDDITPNVPYYYTVTSVDASGNESSTDIMAAPYRANPFEPSL